MHPVYRDGWLVFFRSDRPSEESEFLNDDCIVQTDVRSGTMQTAFGAALVVGGLSSLAGSAPLLAIGENSPWGHRRRDRGGPFSCRSDLAQIWVDHNGSQRLFQNRKTFP